MKVCGDASAASLTFCAIVWPLQSRTSVLSHSSWVVWALAAPPELVSQLFWGSWAVALHMIHQRHPEVADRIVAGLSHPEGLPNLSGVAEAANCLRGVEYFEPPSWDELKLGARPQQFHEWDDYEPGGVRGWQHEASSRVERRHRTREVFPVVTDAERALIRAQSGPGGGTSFSAFPSCFLTRVDSHLFCVLLLHRLLFRASADVAVHLILGSVRGFWSFGEAWFCCGVGSSTDLPRRRGACDHEQDDPRHGFGSSHN